jgi:hypothetical protein
MPSFFRVISFAALAILILSACAKTLTGQEATAPATTAASASNAAQMSASAYCAKLQPLVQQLVKPALALFKASDPTTNDLQAGDAAYIECDFRPPSTQVDISLHDDSDHEFDDAGKQGYAALAGFGDKARYTVENGEMRWVDVVRRSIACEARFTMKDAEINRDWKQAAGKICEAALSAR